MRFNVSKSIFRPLFICFLYVGAPTFNQEVFKSQRACNPNKLSFCKLLPDTLSGFPVNFILHLVLWNKPDPLRGS